MYSYYSGVMPGTSARWPIFGSNIEPTLMAVTESGSAGELFIVHDSAGALECLYHRGGYEALKGVTQRQCFLDLRLAKMDGLEVLRRKKDGRGAISGVVPGSSREERDLLRTYGLGTNSYIMKPMAYHDFVETIEQVGRFWAMVNQPLPGGGRWRR